MKIKSAVIAVLVLLFCSPILGQVISREQFRYNEWELKSRLWQNEKESNQQEMILDQNDFDVKYWELYYDVTDISGQILRGKTTQIAQSVVDGLTSVDYNFASGMTVDSVRMNGAPATFTRPSNILRITLDRAYNNGELFTTVVYYHGHPDPSGFGAFTYDSHNGWPLITTLSEPEGAREWWPCKDGPHDKADSSDVYITCRDDLVGVSNGVMVSNQNNGNGTRTFHWHISYPITTYLICMGVTNYQSFTDWYVAMNGDSMPVTNYVYPELYDAAVEDFNIVPEAIGIFASMFGEYPFVREKFGYSLFPWGGGMEHQDNVFFGSMLISGYHYYDWITIHEMAHMWFGDAITCDIWPDIWMNEGFASYLEALYYERLNGFSSYLSYMQNSNGVYDPSGPIYNPSQLFDGNTVYNKGSWVLHILRGVMGDSAFFQGMRNYAYHPDHVYGTITTRDFQHLMEPFYGDSLGWFFDEWVWGQNRPTYRYSWTKTDIGGGQYEVFVHVRQTQTSPAPDVFTMPIRLYPRINNVDTMISVYNDARIGDYRFIVNGNPTILTFDRDNWILRTATSENYTMNIVTTSLSNGTVGNLYSDTIEARGGVQPYHFALYSGHLPGGLSLNLNTGEISGTPTTAEVDTFTIRCTDSSGPVKTDDQIYIVTISQAAVLDIVTLTLPNGKFDSSYSEIIGVNGGQQPYTFTVIDGQLPAGLTINATTGLIDGITTEVGIDSFTVECVDSSLPQLSDQQRYGIQILGSGCNYIAGDIGANGSVNGIDVVYAVNYLKGGPAPPIDCHSICVNEPNPFFAAMDVNGNCATNGIDITFFVRFLKGQEPALLYCPDCLPGL